MTSSLCHCIVLSVATICASTHPRYRLRSSAIQPDIETKKDASASSMRVRLLWSQPRALPRSSAIGTEAQSAQEAMIHVHATAPYPYPADPSAHPYLRPTSL